ncbi:MAG TPA: glycosyltransferase [Puia sp.]|nr:glycosyltransferase [Puia sp.]
MHYALLTYGSMGDIRPFVALGLGLQKNGHRVTLAAPENFKSFVEGFGVTYYPLAGNMEEIVNTDEVIRVIRSGNNFSFLRKLQRLADRTRAAIVQGLMEVSKDADVLVTSTLNIFYVDAIAGHLHKKWAMMLPSPPMIETKEFPYPELDGLNFPAYNRLTYRLVNFAYWLAYKSRINTLRMSLGLPPQVNNPLRQYVEDAIPTLFIFSPQLIPRPADWSAHCQVTGFLTLDEQPTIDPRLDNWLKAGDPPLYIGFGSIPIPDQKRLSAIIGELLMTHRIVFCKGWSSLPDLPQHPSLFTLDHADHSWLLPQCKVAIHHGGAGTVGAALKAKIPSIVVSIFGDQAMWGKIVQRRAVGRHIPFKHLTTKKLLRAIRAATSPPISPTVITIGEKVMHEDGIANAIEKLATWFN